MKLPVFLLLLQSSVTASAPSTEQRSQRQQQQHISDPPPPPTLLPELSGEPLPGSVVLSASGQSRITVLRPGLFRIQTTSSTSKSTSSATRSASTSSPRSGDNNDEDPETTWSDQPTLQILNRKLREVPEFTVQNSNSSDGAALISVNTSTATVQIDEGTNLIHFTCNTGSHFRVHNNDKSRNKNNNKRGVKCRCSLLPVAELFALNIILCSVHS